MHTPTQTAKHLRGVFLGGNWTASNLKAQLFDVSWQEATTSVYGLNSIATLTQHISYYLPVVLQVLQGGALEGKDELSFAHPPIESAEDWERMQERIWEEVQALALAIEELPEERLGEDFADEKYGTYFRNLHGLIEHSHYHLGQIAAIKKILRTKR